LPQIAQALEAGGHFGDRRIVREFARQPLFRDLAEDRAAHSEAFDPQGRWRRP